MVNRLAVRGKQEMFLIPLLAVYVQKNGDMVGHVPRKISVICSLFLCRNGTIHCKVTGSRRHSSDIAQGRLEIPCQLFLRR